MKTSFNFFIVILVLAVFSNTFSLPRFALRQGAKCIDCHINPTGGNLRDDGGWNYSLKVLPIVTAKYKDFKMSNKLADNILFGVDYRTQYLVASTDSTTKSDFQKMNGSIYTNVAIDEKINIFARYDFIWGIWEAYGTAHILPNNGYIKAGSFTPNFGIRLDDHTAYTRGGDLGILFSTGSRQGLIYEPRYTETGVEVGAYISDFMFITASVANPRSRQFEADPTYTGRIEFNSTIANTISMFLGGSIVIFKDRKLDSNFKTIFPEVKMYGGFLGFGIEDFTFEGEFDIADDLTLLGSKANVLMLEASYRITKGIEGVVRFDRYDPNTSNSNDEFSRLIIGAEVFPYSFVELRPQFRIQMEDPEVKNNSFVLQFHFFY